MASHELVLGGLNEMIQEKKMKCWSSHNLYLIHFTDGSILKNEINLIDVIKSNNKEISELLHNKDNVAKLNQYFQVLNKREKEIITKRYGLFESDEFTQKEIAEHLNISRSYVSRIEKRAITKLYREFKKEKQEL